MSLPPAIPPPGSSGPKPQGRDATCDACGRVAFCVALPLRGGRSGTLCLACLGRTLRDLQGDTR